MVNRFKINLVISFCATIVQNHSTFIGIIFIKHMLMRLGMNFSLNINYYEITTILNVKLSPSLRKKPLSANTTYQRNYVKIVT